MTATCPHCGGALSAARPAAHRGELERQLGDVERAHALRERAKRIGDRVMRLDSEFIAWRGYVWTRCRLRKPAKCASTGVELPAGAWAWRQLSEVRDRDLRVSAATWAHL